MPQVTMEDSGGFALHEPDEWTSGEIVAIEETPDSGFGPGFKWVIALDDQQDGDFDKWAFTSQKLSPKSKLYSWLTALGMNPAVGEKVELDQLLGLRVQVMFEQFDRDGQLREKITKIRQEKTQTPMQKKQAAAANAKKPPAPRDTTQFVDPDEAPF